MKIFSSNAAGSSVVQQSGSSVVQQPGSSVVQQPGSSVVQQPGSSVVQQPGSSVVQQPGMWHASNGPNWLLVSITDIPYIQDTRLCFAGTSTNCSSSVVQVRGLPFTSAAPPAVDDDC